MKRMTTIYCALSEAGISVAAFLFMLVWLAVELKYCIIGLKARCVDFYYYRVRGVNK